MEYTFSVAFRTLYYQVNLSDPINPVPWKKVHVGVETIAGTLRVGSDLWKFWVALQRRKAEVAEQIQTSRVEGAERLFNDRQLSGWNLQAIQDVEKAEIYFRDWLRQRFGKLFDYGEWDIRIDGEAIRVVTFEPAKRPSY